MADLLHRFEGPTDRFGSVESLKPALETVFLAVTRLQLRISRTDPWFLVIMFGMPLVVMPLFKKTMGLSLVAGGFAGANGAEQVVPGQALLFGFFVAGSVGFSLYREHGWKIWDRLRASAASSCSLLAGFAIPWIIIHIAYQVLLFVIGGRGRSRRSGRSPLKADETKEFFA